jgi:hypothetical protein
MGEEIDPVTLVYSFPKKEGNYHVSAIKCADGKEFRLTSSFLNLLDIHEKDNMIILSIRKDKDSKMIRFYNEIVKTEENTIQNMSKSSETWFRKSIPIHKIESMFRSCISRTSELGQNMFRFKLSKKLKIFNESEENVITLDELKAMEKDTFRLQCSCLVDNLIIGRDAAKLDIKVTQIRIKKNPIPKAAPVVEPPPSDDEFDEDTFDCVELPSAAETADLPRETTLRVPQETTLRVPQETTLRVPQETTLRVVQLSEPVDVQAGAALRSTPVDIKTEETLSRISELKKQLRQAADEDNDDRVGELSIEIKELKKLLAA